MEKQIDIAEIFFSIDGEVNFFGQGRFTTFIRFAGCNLKCDYCDTADTQKFNSNKHLKLWPSKILEVVKKNKCSNITITGGEPFCQAEGLASLCNSFLKSEMFSEDIKINIETNGTLFPDAIKALTKTSRISFTVDYKIGETFHPLWYRHLSDMDTLKIVIKKQSDFEKADVFLKHLKDFFDYTSASLPIIAISGCWGSEVSMEKIIEWSKDSGIEFLNDLSRFKLNFQMHKLLNLK